MKQLSKKQPVFETRIKTNTNEETREIANLIGLNLNDGLVLTLSGPLGSGKTTFVQGLARGLEVPCEYSINSPTYAIMHDYPGRIPLYHIDLYRLMDEEDLYSIGLDEVLTNEGIKAVEWPEKIKDYDFNPDISIALKIEDGDSRSITIIVYRRNSLNLIKALKRFNEL